VGDRERAVRFSARVLPVTSSGKPMRPISDILGGGGNDANAASYNVDVARLASDFRSDRLAVSLVDVHSALNNTTDLSRDGLHPVQSGQDKIAAGFYAAMVEEATFASAPIYRRLVNGLAEAPVGLTTTRCANN
jgi:hypothetical protein